MELKHSEAIERFEQMYMFGEDILGATDKEQNTMFLYMFIEILKIIVEEGYIISLRKDNSGRHEYSCKLQDYGYKVRLLIYSYSHTMIIEFQKKKYQRALITKISDVKHLCDYITDYVNKDTNMCAFLILNNININLLSSVVVGDDYEDEV